MAALLTVRGGKKEDVLDNLKEAKRMGIKILPPDINKSDIGFFPDNEGIRFGIKSIDGVGDKAVEYILMKRREGGPFQDFDEFIERVVNQFAKTLEYKSNPVNRSVIRQLIKAGCFDEFEPNRYVLLNHYNFIVRKDKTWAGSEDELEKMKEKSTHSVYYSPSDYNEKRMLQMEFELIGIYVTKSPYEGLPYVAISDMDFVSGWKKEPAYDVGGRIVKIKTTKIKKGKSAGKDMAHITIETQFDSYRITAFADEYEEYLPHLYTDNILVFRVYKKKGFYNGADTEDLILDKILVKEAKKLKKEMGIKEQTVIGDTKKSSTKEKDLPIIESMKNAPVKDDPIADMFSDTKEDRRRRRKQMREEMNDLFGVN